jgi:hypothetical protein
LEVEPDWELFHVEHRYDRSQNGHVQSRTPSNSRDQISQEINYFSTVSQGCTQNKQNLTPCRKAFVLKGFGVNGGLPAKALSTAAASSPQCKSLPQNALAR